MSNNNTKGIKKTLSIIGNTLLWLFVAFSLIVTISVFSAQNDEDKIPSLFGKSMVNILTDSMKDEFKAGDMIFVDKIELDEAKNLEKGTVIVFRAPIDINGDGELNDINTHRIVEIDANGNYITKGDNNPLKDNEGDNPYTVNPKDVIGVYSGGKLAGIGNVMNFLRTSLGFFLCIVLPLILFFIYELYRFIAVLISEKNKKNAVSKETEEEIKRKAIEEYLNAQKAADSANDVAKAEAPEVEEAEAPEAEEAQAPAVEEAEEAQAPAVEETKAEDTSDAPADASADAPADASADTTADTTADAPADDTPADAPADTPADAPADATADTSADDTNKENL